MKLKDKVLFFKKYDGYGGGLWLIGGCTYELWEEINQKINRRNKYSDTLICTESMRVVDDETINRNAINKLKKLIEK